MKYATPNLGDEIQTLAAMRFLPHIDAWVDRERLDKFRNWRTHRIILNGWFMHRPEHWPPAKRLKPLIVSFHLTNEIFRENINRVLAPSTILGPQGIDYLRRHEPIGTRDTHTLVQLQNAGIEAYFSGCLTLTLQVADAGPRDGTVYAVDIPNEAFAALSRQCKGPLIRLSHQKRDLKGNARFEKAKMLLAKYATARAVVTTRLHCALPCLALGTPVLFLETAPDAYRFDGLRDFLHKASPEAVIENQADFDINDPPPNSTQWHTLRDGLIASCQAFIGTNTTI